MNELWTIIKILKVTTEFFSEKGLENPRLNAEQLLCHLLSLKRVDLYVQFERILTPEEVTAYREMIRRRSRREPLQYITGETEFMGLNFRLTPDVLIPRPETEILVEAVLKLRGEITNPRILDIGTGSGCIAVSLAHEWPEAQVTGLDISESALQMAEKNSELNNVSERVTFRPLDILTGSTGEEAFDIIVSNPPYIALEEMAGLDAEVRDYEPSIALTDGGDGTLFYRRILSLIKTVPECKFAFIELSGILAEKQAGIAESEPFSRVDVIPDLNNLPRVLRIRR
jgi:release factor glutamine methyltransferase